MILYRIMHRATGRAYIGLTTASLEKRWSAHLYRMRKGVKSALYDALRRYGVEAFDISAIVSLVPDGDLADLKALEIAVIAQEGTFGSGYNLTSGGDGTVGYTPSPDQLEKMRGRPASEKQRSAVRISNTGRRHTVDAKLRIGVAAKVRNSGNKYCVGRVATESQREKMKTAWTQDRRAAQSEIMRARRAEWRI